MGIGLQYGSMNDVNYGFVDACERSKIEILFLVAP
jgi:hypothetical protein